MDLDTQQDSHPQVHRDVRRDGLQVLIDLDVREGSDEQGMGCPVAVVEHLRLQVPADAQQAWLEAELQTWDPWLRQQKGFLGREVLWDKDRQEGVLLIHWANRQDWKAIPMHAVAAIQQEFEAVAKHILALPPHSENPFPLLYTGETGVS